MNLEKCREWLHNKLQILDTISTNNSSTGKLQTGRRDRERERKRDVRGVDTVIWRCQNLRKMIFLLVFVHHVIRQIRLRLRRLQQREAWTSNELEKLRNDSSALKPNLFTGRTTEMTAIYRYWVYLAHFVATTSIHLRGISRLSRKLLEDHTWGHYFRILWALNSNLL